jgi:hypothetical protein
MKTGKVSTSRTVICARCISGNEDLKDMVDKMKEIGNARPAKLIKKLKRGEQETGCGRCGRKLTPTTPTVALLIEWDCNTKRFVEGNVVWCKDCYNADRKTRLMWQYLAKLGRNPNFTPTMVCHSWEKCATYARSKNTAFNCKHIAVIMNQTEANLVCNRGHPKQWRIQQGDGHMFPVTGSLLFGPGTKVRKRKGKRGKVQAGISISGSTNTQLNGIQAQLPTLVKKLMKSIKKMDKASKEIEDPGMKAFVEAQVEMQKNLFGLIPPLP